MDSLANCPFCGGEADLIDMSDEYEGEYWVAHQCPSGASAETYSYETAAEAIAAWNTRYHSEFEETVIKAWKEIKDYQERTCKPHGEWERVSQTQEIRHIYCDCGEYLGMDRRNSLPFGIECKADMPNYCPQCGAKVIGGNDA